VIFLADGGQKYGTWSNRKENRGKRIFVRKMRNFQKIGSLAPAKLPSKVSKALTRFPFEFANSLPN
jgi:hypothetical protein